MIAVVGGAVRLPWKRFVVVAVVVVVRFVGQVNVVRLAGQVSGSGFTRARVPHVKIRIDVVVSVVLFVACAAADTSCVIVGPPCVGVVSPVVWLEHVFVPCAHLHAAALQDLNFPAPLKLSQCSLGNAAQVVASALRVVLVGREVPGAPVAFAVRVGLMVDVKSPWPPVLCVVFGTAVRGVSGVLG